MLISGKNIETFSAKLLNRRIYTSYINSSYDWLSSAIEGVLLGQKYEHRDIELTFLINEKDEDIAYKQISALTESLRICQIKFDDIDLLFPCFLQGSAEPERLKNGKFRVVYSLKNDWGVGDKIIQSFDFVPVDCTPLKVEYVLHWQNTMDYYIDCFDVEEQQQVVGEETVWIDRSNINNLIAGASSWDQLLLNLGVDLQAYHPENALLGTTWIQDVYNYDNAMQMINNGTIRVVYMRFHKDGYPDFPEADYPSLVWTVADKNKYYIDLGIGNGWDIRDISIYVTGRYFNTVLDGNGCIVGANSGNPFNIAFENPDATIETDRVNTDLLRYEVIQSSSSGGEIVFQTLESISGLPLRTYGFRSSQDSGAPVTGYCDIIFNGTTLDRVPIDSYILTNNLSIMYGNQGIGNYIEISRVQVYYKGELVLDAIPIDGHIKNGFINTYDGGFYDVLHMKFLPWVNYVTSEVGPHPDDIMDPDIEPPTPGEDEEYIITLNLNGGSLSGPTTLTTVDGRLTNLPTPTRQGFIFQGWFTSNAGGTRVTTNTVFVNNMTIYARWVSDTEIVAHTITLMVNGGTLNSSNTVTVQHGSTVSLPTPYRENYIFQGWFTAVDGGTQFTNTTIVIDDIVLYARWINSGSEETSNITVTIVDTNGNIINNNDSVYAGTRVMLVSSDSSATIKYTLDGSDPRNGINYTSYITVNDETEIRCIAEKDGMYGPEVRVQILIQEYIPPQEAGRLLQYDEVAPGTYDLMIGANTTPADWDIDPPRALLPFVAVYSVAGVAGTWQYYSNNWMEKIRTGTLADGRAYIILNVTTFTSKEGAYVRFIPDNGNPTVTQTFNIASAM